MAAPMLRGWGGAPACAPRHPAIPPRAATGQARAAALKNAPRKRAPRRNTRIALAMAGGGPLGAIYEIGALTALSEALRGVDLNDLDMYVGVSAGGIIGAGLANRITPRDMCAMFIEPRAVTEPGHAIERFDPAVLMRPALQEFGQRLRTVPRLLAQSAWHYFTDRRSQGLIDSFGRLTQALPAGLFSIWCSAQRRPRAKTHRYTWAIWRRVCRYTLVNSNIWCSNARRSGCCARRPVLSCQHD